MGTPSFLATRYRQLYEMQRQRENKATFQVPQGNVDASKRTHKDWPAPVEARSPGHLPYLLDITVCLSAGCHD